MGPEGHTASLFPGTTGLRETEPVAAAYIEKLVAYRITFTPPTLTNSGGAPDAGCRQRQGGNSRRRSGSRSPRPTNIPFRASLPRTATPSGCSIRRQRPSSRTRHRGSDASWPTRSPSSKRARSATRSIYAGWYADKDKLTDILTSSLHDETARCTAILAALACKLKFPLTLGHMRAVIGGDYWYSALHASITSRRSAASSSFTGTTANGSTCSSRASRR